MTTPARPPAPGPPWPTTGAPGCVAFGTLMVVDAPPGGGPKLHRHPYEEVFIVQEGTATFTAGDETVEVKSGCGRLTYTPANDSSPSGSKTDPSARWS